VRRALHVGSAVLISAAVISGCGSGTHSDSGPAAPTITATPDSISPSSASSADVIVVATPAGSAVELASAQTLQVLPPPKAPTTGVFTRYEVQPAGSPTLVATGPAGRFVAARPGTATILVAQAPRCPIGQECPAHVVAVGSVRVTVTG
jgi:hypothetical protein